MGYVGVNEAHAWESLKHCAFEIYKACLLHWNLWTGESYYLTSIHQIWVAVWSHVEDKLWNFAVICLNDAPSLTPYRTLTSFLPLTLCGTYSGLWLMVFFSYYYYTGLDHVFPSGYLNHWTSLTVLPDSLFLQFDCGVKVQLGFAAEFSNVMVIYTRILEKPADIVSCSAQLSSFPLVCSLLSWCDKLRFNDLISTQWRMSCQSAM